MKKTVTWILLFVMAIALYIPAATEDSYGAVSVRTSMPSYSSAEGKTYYYTNNNIFYKCNLAPTQKISSSYGKYVTGNCTWYAYARASEMNIYRYKRKQRLGETFQQRLLGSPEIRSENHCFQSEQREYRGGVHL